MRHIGSPQAAPPDNRCPGRPSGTKRTARRIGCGFRLGRELDFPADGAQNVTRQDGRLARTDQSVDVRLRLGRLFVLFHLRRITLVDRVHVSGDLFGMQLGRLCGLPPLSRGGRPFD